MQFAKKVFTLIFALLLFVSFANNAYAALWLDFDDDGLWDEEEDLLLTRVDYNDPDCPDHERNEGKYGFWDGSENFILVVDFYESQPYQSPYTEDDVFWIPGPMDK